MITPPEHSRVGVNFPSSEQNYLTIRGYATVEPSDMIVPKWPHLRTSIVEILKELPWAVLSVVRSLHHSSEPSFSTITTLGECPVILVGAPTESQASWLTMADRIYSLCLEAGLAHARILFESMPFPLAVGDQSLLESSNGKIPDSAWLQQSVPMGSSLGLAGNNKISASMGGSIKLQGKGEEQSEFLLSVFHPFAGLFSEEQRLRGYRYDADQHIDLTIPSLQDADCARTNYAAQKEKLESSVGSGEKKFISSGDDKFRVRVEELKKTMENQEKALQRFQNDTNRKPGVLQYGSGFGRGTDWSLSSFEDRILSNTWPAQSDVKAVLSTQNVDEDVIHQLTKEYEEHPTVDNLASSVVDEMVVMQGRTSGLTVGKVNALKSDVILGRSLTLKQDVTFEACAIVGWQGSPIVRPGDSGAWCLNLKGEWVGSVVGRHASIGTSIGLVLEAEKTVEDIEAFTGMKVVSPARAV